MTIKPGSVVTVKKMFVNFGATSPVWVEADTPLLVLGMLVNKEGVNSINFLAPDGQIVKYMGKFVSHHFKLCED